MRGLVFFAFLFFPQAGFAKTPDCIYTGRGEVYDFNGNHLKEKSFDLYLERFKSDKMSYTFREIKTFANGFKTELDFAMGWYIGNFSMNDGAGRVVKGRCIDFGYCVGKNEFPDFKGTFVTRFNEKAILTTTTTDTLIVDEVVKPKNSSGCSFE